MEEIKSIPEPRGFTLIELLVVVAIISLLVSILLSSLSKAKEIAKATICSHQLKGISLGMAEYLGRENELFPYVCEYLSGKWVLWQFALRDFCPIEGDYNGNYDEKNAGLFHCPNDEFRLKRGYSPASYGGNYHADCRWINRPDALAVGYVARISSVPRPSEKVYAIDSLNIGGGYITVYRNSPGIDPASSDYTNQIEFRHNDTANTMFMDWHVDTLIPDDTLGHPEWVCPLDK